MKRLLRSGPRAPRVPEGSWLVLGLGNPGDDYESSRHNAGATAVEILAERLRVRLGRFAGPARVAMATLAENSVVLARSKTYMNDSGIAAARLVASLGLDPNHLIVVCDDLDLPMGRLRIRARGSSGGHNGLRSIEASLRSREFIRVRIGIGRPPGGVDAIEHVLGQLQGDQREQLRRACARAADAVSAVVAEGIEKAMTEYNQVTASDGD